MASKQETSKKNQGYNPKPVQKMCSNCVHFALDTEEIKSYGGVWTKEKNIRCTLGGFAVKKMGNCIEHKFKDAVT